MTAVVEVPKVVIPRPRITCDYGDVEMTINGKSGEFDMLTAGQEVMVGGVFGQQRVLIGIVVVRGDTFVSLNFPKDLQL